MAEERHPLHELFEDQIKDLYSAENQILKALPKMAKNSTNAQLRAAFERHLEETRGHVARLEQIAEELDFTPKGKKCKGAEGVIEEGKEVMEEFEGETLDAGLIGAAQRVEHYEIAGYGTARTHAELLGYKKAARLLQQTLDEEERTDKKLTQIAESVVNVEALQEV
jgi:ferritin-like metal-binding protein YciE